MVTKMEFSDDEHRWLLQRRGGCTCFLSAPCGACVDSPDPDEVAEIVERREEAALEAEASELAAILRDDAACW